MTYPEPAPGVPITWRCRTNGAQSYTFVAVRILGSGWFVTGQITRALSWDELCYYLPPEDGRFLVLGVVSQITAAFPNGAP